MRKTDTTTARFARSSDRIHAIDGAWYVRTREGERGPFRNRRLAENELRLYIDTMKYLDDFGGRVPAKIDRRDVIVVDMDAPAWG